MKSLLVTLVALQLFFLASAQEVVKKKEVGIVFSNFDNFGMTFRTGTANSLWRYSAVLLSGGNTKTTGVDNSNNVIEGNLSSLGSRVSFGKEFRKGISEKFYLRYGADISAGYSTTKTENKNTTTLEFIRDKSAGYNVGFNLVFGANYSLSSNFIVGAELLPYVQYRNGSTTQTGTNMEPNTTDYSGFNYGLSSSSVSLSLVYQW